MNRHNPLTQILIAPILKPNLPNHLKQSLLVIKLINRFHQILIRFSITRNKLPHERDNVEGVEPVGFRERPPGDFGEFEATEFATSFEDTVGFAESFGGSGDVAETKGDGVGVEGIGFERELFRVGTDEFDVVLGVSEFVCFFFPVFEHRSIDV